MARQRSTQRSLSREIREAALRRRKRANLTREERDVWYRAYLIAFAAAADRDGHVMDRSLSGLVRAAEEAAWASVDAYRRALKGERP